MNFFRVASCFSLFKRRLHLTHYRQTQEKSNFSLQRVGNGIIIYSVPDYTLNSQFTIDVCSFDGGVFW